MNYMAPVSLGPDWAEVEVPFAALRPLAARGAESSRWTPADVGWVGLSVSAPKGTEVLLDLDRIAFYGGPDAPAAPASPTPGAGSPVIKTHLIDPGPLRRLAWQPLAGEAPGDGLRGDRLPDAISLAWAQDGDRRAWFRVRLAPRKLPTSPQASWTLSLRCGW